MTGVNLHSTPVSFCSIWLWLICCFLSVLFSRLEATATKRLAVYIEDTVCGGGKIISWGHEQHGTISRGLGKTQHNHFYYLHYRCRLSSIKQVNVTAVSVTECDRLPFNYGL